MSVPITFAPTATGDKAGQLVVDSSTGNVSVLVTGTGVAGAAHLSLTPTDVDFGSVPVGSTVIKTFDISNTGNLLLTITKAAPPTAPFVVPTPVSEGQQLSPDDVIHQSVSFTPTAAGTSSGKYLITGNDGQGAQTVTVHGVGAAPSTGTTVPAPSAGGWQANGSATQSGANTVLTPATSAQAGDVVYPNAVTTAGLHVSFTAQISGGTGADGLAFDLLDATTASPTSLGSTGCALGYGGLNGIAVALDTYQNVGDPSANFMGIATGTTREGHDSLTYAATAAAPTWLRAGTHSVDVTVTSTSVAVVLDGGAPLTAHVSVPARALLAFSAGTGGLTDIHTVRGVNITRAGAETGTPSGPITGIAGKCVDIAGANSADRTPMQLYTCDGTGAQTWVAQANGTIRNPQSGRCLDDPAANTAYSTQLVISDCASGTDELWQLSR